MANARTMASPTLGCIGGYGPTRRFHIETACAQLRDSGSSFRWTVIFQDKMEEK